MRKKMFSIAIFTFYDDHTYDIENRRSLCKWKVIDNKLCYTMRGYTDYNPIWSGESDKGAAISREFICKLKTYQTKLGKLIYGL